MKPYRTITLKLPYTLKELKGKSEAELIDIIGSSEDLSKESKENLISIALEVGTKEKDYHLAKETFEVVAAASAKYIPGIGNIQAAAAGSIVFDSLYLGNQETLEEIKEDVDVYFNLCYKASSIINFIQGDIKKN